MNPFAAVLKPTRSRRLNELVGMAMMVSALLLFLALVSYHPSDPSWNTAAYHGARAANWVGLTGAAISDVFLQLIGITSLSLPILIGFLGWAWMRSLTLQTPWAKWVGAGLWFLSVPALLAMLPWHWKWQHAAPIEGLSGRLVSDFLIHFLNVTGAVLVTLAIAAIAMYLTTTFSFRSARAWAAVRFAFVQAWIDRYNNWKLARHQSSERKRLLRQQTKALREAARTQARAEKSISHSAPSPEADGRLAFEDAIPEPLPSTPAPSMWSNMPRAKVPVERRAPPPEPVAAAPVTAMPVAPGVTVDGASAKSLTIAVRADAVPSAVTVTPKSLSGFRLPPSSLLHRSEKAHNVREDELRDQAQVLIEKCAEFDVTGQVTQINPGPVVTTYEFKPEAGVKYSRVTGLAEDLCLAMQAESILIERMAGKSTVGIQVPNLERETIWLRDVIESDAFNHSRSRLTIAMGKDINGRIVTADLAVMPHVLIAGSTGSGKSVAINAMIMSLLYKATPAQVRLILVDPKRVELGMYEGIPHLFTPIITEPKLAANALRNAVREMERRLKLLASRSVRNIEGYNKLFDGNSPGLFDEGEAEQPLPYIVIIIDELADLMMLDKANVEESITRLAQMARAVGIHLILATQRPSVDVITGLIKANVPTRMSFRLATKVDSRTILDSNGAEALLGRGDLLFLPPGTSRLHRVHAPFVTEKEIGAVVDFWKDQGQAEYVQGFLESPRDERRELEPGEEADGTHDEMFEDAVRLVLEFGKASTSLLQRRLRIGYGRAAHLIDLMERDGIVGPADGPKPREILKPPDWITQVEASLR